MTILFNSMFSGVSIIWDRELGYLKELLAAPTSRTTIVLGRALGGATTSVLQGFIILILGILLGLASPSIPSIVIALVIMALFSTIIVLIGIAFASVISEVETFQLIMNLIIFPLFFLSNALFPTSQLPAWIRDLTALNPVSYGIDALRGVIIQQGTNPLILDLGVMVVLLAVALGISSYLFSKTSI